MYLQKLPRHARGVHIYMICSAKSAYEAQFFGRIMQPQFGTGLKDED
jgi:hypothetical protein